MGSVEVQISFWGVGGGGGKTTVPEQQEYTLPWVLY